MEASGSYAAIYNGKEETPHVPAVNAGSHPYFSSHEFQEGKLFYNHTWYESIPLRYDMLRDELAVRSRERAFNSLLDREAVQEAWLAGAHIVRWEPELWTGVPPCNYLFLVHEGRYPVVKKTGILRVEKVTPEGVSVSYLPDERFYIRVDNACYPVSGKKSLLKRFPGDRQALNAFIKNHALKFGKQQRELSLLTLIRYIETLHE
jgi:hypothetical protein